MSDCRHLMRVGKLFGFDVVRSEEIGRMEEYHAVIDKVYMILVNVAILRRVVFEHLVEDDLAKVGNGSDFEHELRDLPRVDQNAHIFFVAADEDAALIAKYTVLTS